MKEFFKIFFTDTLRLNKIIWKDKKWIFLLYFFVVATSGLTYFLYSGASALYINELIKIAGKNQITDTLIYAVIILITSIFLPAFLSRVENYIDLLFYMFMEEKSELSIIKKYAEIDVAIHENPKYKDLFNKITEGTWRIGNFADRQFFLLRSIVGAGAASVVLLYTNWKIFLILFIGILPELIAGIYYGKRVWTINTSKAETRRMFWHTRDHFFHLPSLVELKIFQNTEHFYNVIKELFFNFRKEQYKNNKDNFKNQIITTIISQTVFSISVVFFILKVVDGSIMIGTLTFIIASIDKLRGSLSSLFTGMSQQYQDGLFVSDFFEFLDIEPALKKPTKGIVINKDVAPEITFDNVTFYYPDSKTPSLKNFNLKIKAGEKVAIVGLNGAGKTTFVKLLCRFYDPTEGRILINGFDLKEIDIESWYGIIGAIFQDYSSYYLPVKEAIAIGRTGKKTDLEKVIDAAKAAEADIFIEKWEKAYEQMLGKGFTEGVEPSIGQWQKLALAKTFYRDPKLMILDEPTSSIDAESEAKIFEKIENVSDGRTTIMISHRFSTVKKSNNIVVIKDGEKLEEGSHDELMKRKGKYAELYELQAKSYQNS